MSGRLIGLLAALAAGSAAGAPCPVAGEAIQWAADYCMLKLETDDEIAVSGCIEEETRAAAADACASKLHFKQRLCARMIENGTRSGTAEACLGDPDFKGRTVEAGGVGA